MGAPDHMSSSSDDLAIKVLKFADAQCLPLGKICLYSFSRTELPGAEGMGFQPPKYAHPPTHAHAHAQGSCLQC